MPTELLVCPFCGAPYRNVIPSDTVHVRCKYCGGTIIVPSNAPRCPNHPDVLALSMCNDCGGRLCRECLTNYAVEGNQEGGMLYLCPDCLKSRFLGRADSEILFGVLIALTGLFILFISPVLGVILIILLAAPVIGFGIYRTRKIRHEIELYSSPKEVAGNLVDEGARFVYRDMLVKYVKIFGPIHGSLMLENQIKKYVNEGLSQEEAIKKLALEEGYFL